MHSLSNIIQNAKDFPHVGIGMSVEIYQDGVCLAEGRVLSMAWSEYFMQYIVSVCSEDCIYDILAGCLRRACGPVRDVITGGKS